METDAYPRDVYLVDVIILPEKLERCKKKKMENKNYSIKSVAFNINPDEIGS